MRAGHSARGADLDFLVEDQDGPRVRAGGKCFADRGPRGLGHVALFAQVLQNRERNRRHWAGCLGKGLSVGHILRGQHGEETLQFARRLKGQRLVEVRNFECALFEGGQRLGGAERGDGRCFFLLGLFGVVFLHLGLAFLGFRFSHRLLGCLGFVGHFGLGGRLVTFGHFRLWLHAFLGRLHFFFHGWLLRGGGHLVGRSFLDLDHLGNDNFLRRAGFLPKQRIVWVRCVSEGQGGQQQQGNWEAHGGGEISRASSGRPRRVAGRTWPWP